MRKFVFLSLLWTGAATAQVNVFYTYSQWVDMQPIARVAYISGAIDSLVIVASDERGEATARHYYKCLARSHMTNAQISENIIAFAKTKPELQGGSVQMALINYMISMCGAPPGQ